MPLDPLLHAIDVIRGIGDRIGVRPYVVAILVRRWSGARPGVDASYQIDDDQTFFVDGGTHRPRVFEVSQRDIIASGGVFQDQDLKIGPITPPFTGAGNSAANKSTISIFDPVQGSMSSEIFFYITGPGMGAAAGANAGGSWFKKISMSITRPFRYEFVVRRTGEIPNGAVVGALTGQLGTAQSTLGGIELGVR